MAFEQFYQELQQQALANPPQQNVPVAPQYSPMFNKNILMQNIYDIPNMGDAELRNFISRHFVSIFNNIFNADMNIASDHIRCFTDVRFLDALIDVLQINTFYDNDIIIKCNNVCYDYLSLNSSRDPEVVARMIRIGNIINRNNLPRLLGLGLRQDLATMINISRYSSFDLSICVRRVNHILITQPKAVMSFEMITEIFKIIYGERGIWIRAFQYFMFDVIPEYNEYDINAHWVTEEVEEINSTINIVILDLLNYEPYEVIRGALVNYAEIYSMMNRNSPIRFTMQRLSDDYSRINDVVDALKEECIIVP